MLLIDVCAGSHAATDGQDEQQQGETGSVSRRHGKLPVMWMPPQPYFASILML
jgi:hypothetical protein